MIIMKFIIQPLSNFRQFHACVILSTLLLVPFWSCQPLSQPSISSGWTKREERVRETTSGRNGQLSVSYTWQDCRRFIFDWFLQTKYEHIQLVYGSSNSDSLGLASFTGRVGRGLGTRLA